MIGRKMEARRSRQMSISRMRIHQMRLLVRLRRLLISSIVILVICVCLSLIRIVLIVLVVVVRITTRAVHATRSITHMELTTRSHHLTILHVLPIAGKANTLLLSTTWLAPQVELMQSIASTTLTWQFAILANYFFALASPFLLKAVVVTRRPSRILLHVFQSSQSGLFVVLGLLGSLKLMPFATKDLINSSAFAQCTLGNNSSALLFHEQHKSVQRLFHMRLLWLLLHHNMWYRRCQVTLLFNIVVLAFLLDIVIWMKWITLVMMVTHIATHMALLTIWVVLYISHMTISHWVIVLVALILFLSRRA